MNRAHPLASPRRRPLLVLAVAVLVAAAGCVYRPTIQQGNLLKVEDVDQVQVGMTRSQVRYVLGTPMISDPFQPQRWDYIYTLRRGRDPHIDRAHFVVYFEGDKVARVENLGGPKPAAPPKPPPQKAPEPAPSSAAAPPPAPTGK